MLQTLLLVALSTFSCAQTAPAAVPVSKEGHHHLVLENEYVRVYSVEVPPHSETLIHQHDLDYVFVTLGDSDVENVRVGEKPVRLQLKDGEVHFTKGGFAHKAINNGDKPFRNVTIEIKDPALTRQEYLCEVGKSDPRCGELIADGMFGWDHLQSIGKLGIHEYYFSTRKLNIPRFPEARARNLQLQDTLIVAVSKMKVAVAGEAASELLPGQVRWISRKHWVKISGNDYVKGMNLSIEP